MCEKGELAVFVFFSSSKVSKSELNSKSFEKLSWNSSCILALLQFASNFKEITCHSDFNTTTAHFANYVFELF